MSKLGKSFIVILGINMFVAVQSFTWQSFLVVILLSGLGLVWAIQDEEE